MTGKSKLGGGQKAARTHLSTALHLPWGSGRVILELVQDALLGSFGDTNIRRNKGMQVCITGGIV
jgi:hypothetical protein